MWDAIVVIRFRLRVAPAPRSTFAGLGRAHALATFQLGT